MDERTRSRLRLDPAAGLRMRGKRRGLAILAACLCSLVGAGVLGCGGDGAQGASEAASDQSSEISAYGLRAHLPPGWAGRSCWSEGDEAEGSFMPVMHLASFSLSPSEGSSYGEDLAASCSSYGEDLAASMPVGEIVAALVEYPPGAAGDPLFGAEPPARLRWADFDPESVKVRLSGRVGLQRFVTANGRAFGLYVVASEPRDMTRLDQLNAVLQSLEIEARAARGSPSR